ncbi:MAG TPA: hypothetical protein VG675_13375 [Bryobacteraceae bacterium]|nr:hypothetical protein [Bryobacteraceae bacterium]
MRGLTVAAAAAFWCFGLLAQEPVSPPAEPEHPPAAEGPAVPESQAKPKPDFVRPPDGPAKPHFVRPPEKSAPRIQAETRPKQCAIPLKNALPRPGHFHVVLPEMRRVPVPPNRVLPMRKVEPPAPSCDDWK